MGREETETHMRSMLQGSHWQDLTSGAPTMAPKICGSHITGFLSKSKNPSGLVLM